MTVSVIIPTYNHRDYVLEAIESVFAQTLADHEVIVVNDGSPDDTAEVLRPLREAGRIRYVEQPNQGQAAARNRGIAEARGEFVALLDDDDRWPPDKLAWQVQAMRESPETVLVYGTARKMSADGELLPADSSKRPTPAGEVYNAFRRGCWIMSPGQTLIRAAALRAAGGFDTNIWGSDDWDLYIRLARRGPFAFADRVALHYRQHAANASRHVVRHARNHFKVVRRHIGWNVPLLVAHQRAAADFFVGPLLRAAHESRVAGRHGDALRAQMYAAAFDPALLVRRSWLVPLVRNIMRRPPRGPR